MGESLPLILLLGVAVIGMLFLSQRNKKQQAKQVDFRNTLQPGAQIMTSSGQLGTIVSVVGDAVTIETTPGVRTRWVKAAIQAVPPQFASVLEPTPETDYDDLDALDAAPSDQPDTAFGTATGTGFGTATGAESTGTDEHRPDRPTL